MHAPLKHVALSAHEDQGAPVVVFMAALCDWHVWDKAGRSAQAPSVWKEKGKTNLTAGAWSCESIQAAASRDFHGGDLLVSDL